MSYQKLIAEELARKGKADRYDPRHIEGYIRLAYGTLDHLSLSQLRVEVKIACECVDMGGTDAAELCAQSFGLLKRRKQT